MTAKSGALYMTGATGWLGKRVVEAILRGLPDCPQVTDFSRIVAFALPSEDTSALIAEGIEVRRGDIRDTEAVAEFVADADGGTLMHLAGMIHPAGRTRDFYDINTAGTLNLYDAATKAGLRRAVVMSSNSPIGANPNPDHRFTEESPYNPYMGYGRSKRRMEEGLLERMARPDACETVILRAPWFYGPGQPPRQTQFFSMIKKGMFPMFGGGHNRRSMGYTDNLAEGCLLAATRPEAAGEIFWIADEEPYKMIDIIETVGAVLREDFGIDAKSPKVKVPGLVADMARVADKSLQTIGLYHQQIHVLSEMNLTIACDISKAKTALGYDPKIALREGMRRSIEWCLQNGQEI